MNALIHNPWFWTTVGLAVFSSIASSMPAPDEKSSVGYKWLYGTLHTLSVNIGNVLPLLKSQFPTNGDSMKKLSIFLLMIALPLMLHAQAPAPSPTPAPQLSNIYAFGVSYNSGAKPEIAGTGLYAHSLAGTGTYAFTVVDAVPTSVKPFVVNTNFGAGIAQKIVTLGKIPIFIPTAAGVSYNGSNTGWSWSTGGMASIKVKGNFRLFPSVRVQKSSVGNGAGYQPIVGILFGYGQ